MRNLPIDELDTTTGELILDAGFVFENGETIETGDYIVCGEDTSTHPLELPRTALRYIITYGKWYILRRDSSIDFTDIQQELLAMEDDIVASFAEDDQDITRIPDIGGW